MRTECVYRLPAFSKSAMRMCCRTLGKWACPTNHICAHPEKSVQTQKVGIRTACRPVTCRQSNVEHRLDDEAQT